MATVEEIADVCERLMKGSISPDDVQGAPDLTDEEKSEIFAYAARSIRALFAGSRKLSLKDAQRKARRLLREFLTPEQRRQLGRRGAFVVTCESGRSYRLNPRYGEVERVVLRGRQWWREGTYCYHEEEDGPMRLIRQPLADRTIGQLLLLLADEARFITEANFTPTRNHGWDGDWQRNLRTAARQRANGCDNCGGRHIANMCEERRALVAELGREVDGEEFERISLRRALPDLFLHVEMEQRISRAPHVVVHP